MVSGSVAEEVTFRVLVSGCPMNTAGVQTLRSSYDRLVNNNKRSFGEMLCRASLGDVLRVARKAYRSVRLSCALGRQRDALRYPAPGIAGSNPRRGFFLPDSFLQDQYMGWVQTNA